MSIAPKFSIGSTRWPGLAKLIEECGELQQVAGKLIATGGESHYWDDTDLHERLHEELADTLAAVRFFVKMNGLDSNRIDARVGEKLQKFEAWQKRGLQGTAGFTRSEP